MSLYNTSPYKHLQRVLYCPCSYTTNAAKQRTGLYMGVSVNSPYSSAHNTAVTQTAYTPPAPRWRAYRQAQHLHQYPDTTATPDAAQLSTAAYYNKVYKGAAVRTVMDPCQTVQHIADHASPAGSAHTVCGSLESSAPDAPVKGCNVSTCTWSARRRLDASHTRRFAVWHWVSSQGAAGTVSGGLLPGIDRQRADPTAGGRNH